MRMNKQKSDELREKMKRCLDSEAIKTLAPCDQFLAFLEMNLAEMCTTQDLIQLGVYTSEQAAANARHKKKCPDYFRLPGRGILYPKAAVLQFIQRTRNEHYNLPDAGSVAGLVELDRSGGMAGKIPCGAKCK